MAILFIDAVGRVLPKYRMVELCTAVELTEEEKLLVILRCSEMKTTEQVNSGGVGLSRQRTLIPIVNDKVYLWAAYNWLKFFKQKELEALDAVFTKYNLPPE